GNSKVGGIVGGMRDGDLFGCIVNADVKATSHSAGGIVGYLENKNMTTAINQSKISNNGVAGSTIKAPSNVGGIIGYIEKDLNTEQNYYYNNYVQAYLESENSENISMGVGSSKDNNEAISNTHIYKYSQINGEYMNED